MTEAVHFKKGYQSIRMVLNDEGIISLLAKRDEKIFEQVFKTHFKSLHAYARIKFVSFGAKLLSLLFQSMESESLRFECIFYTLKGACFIFVWLLFVQ